MKLQNIIILCSANIMKTRVLKEPIVMELNTLKERLNLEGVLCEGITIEKRNTW